MPSICKFLNKGDRTCKISLLFLLLFFSAPNAHAETSFNQREMVCLANNIYHEARGENVKGWEAVAHVTLNRVNHEDFPNTICRVVHQKDNGTCQFSWACSKDSKIKNPEIYQDILDFARKFLSHRPKDITLGSLYYHSTRVRRFSGLSKTIHLNGHVFYK